MIIKRLSYICLALVLAGYLALFPAAESAFAFDLVSKEQMLEVCNDVYLGGNFTEVSVIQHHELTSLQIVVWECDGYAPIVKENGDAFCQATHGIQELVLEPVLRNRPWWQAWLGKEFVGYACEYITE